MTERQIEHHVSYCTVCDGTDHTADDCPYGDGLDPEEGVATCDVCGQREHSTEKLAACVRSALGMP